LEGTRRIAELDPDRVGSRSIPSRVDFQVQAILHLHAGSRQLTTPPLRARLGRGGKHRPQKIAAARLHFTSGFLDGSNMHRPGKEGNGKPLLGLPGRNELSGGPALAKEKRHAAEATARRSRAKSQATAKNQA
jgi:hypothetical protein